MADVKLVSRTRISKTSLALDHSPAKGSLPPEAPAFTLPPRNSRVSAGGTASFDGKRPPVFITDFTEVF
ncbi:hypothetical protein FKM82_028732 [Ascaphus truei]